MSKSAFVESRADGNTNFLEIPKSVLTFSSYTAYPLLNFLCRSVPVQIGFEESICSFLDGGAELERAVTV